jgi:hypothetical protein
METAFEPVGASIILQGSKQDTIMKNSQKRINALQLMARTGSSKMDCAPMVWRVLWSMGFQIPPPHFSPFLLNLLISGLWFGSFGGLILWAIRILNGDPIDVGFFIEVGVLAVTFGILMAVYYAFFKRKHHLPSWNSIQ